MDEYHTSVVACTYISNICVWKMVHLIARVGPLHLSSSYLSLSDETPENNEELLNCRGLEVFVRCYRVSS